MLPVTTDETLAALEAAALEAAALEAATVVDSVVDVAHRLARFRGFFFEAITSSATGATSGSTLVNADRTAAMASTQSVPDGDKPIVLDAGGLDSPPEPDTRGESSVAMVDPVRCCRVVPTFASEDPVRGLERGGSS